MTWELAWALPASQQPLQVGRSNLSYNAQTHGSQVAVMAERITGLAHDMELQSKLTAMQAACTKPAAPSILGNEAKNVMRILLLFITVHSDRCCSQQHRLAVAAETAGMHPMLSRGFRASVWLCLMSMSRVRKLAAGQRWRSERGLVQARLKSCRLLACWIPHRVTHQALGICELIAMACSCHGRSLAQHFHKRTLAISMAGA